MARDFNATTSRIDTTFATNSTTRSWLIWAYREGDGEGGEGRYWEKDGEVLFWPSSDAGIFFFGDWSGNDRHAVWSGTSATNEWDCILVTFDSSSTTNDPILYWNGVAASLAAEQQQTGTKVTGSSVHTIGNTSTGSGTFDGRLCRFAIWDRILTQAEATTLATGADPRTIPGLVYYNEMKGDNDPEPDIVGGSVATVTSATKIAHPDQLEFMGTTGNAYRNIEVGNGMSRSEGAT